MLNTTEKNSAFTSQSPACGARMDAAQLIPYIALTGRENNQVAKPLVDAKLTYSSLQFNDLLDFAIAE